MQAVSGPFYNQQIPKMNPISTQLLQTLNRDPRLRKVENAVKSLPSLNTNDKQPLIKNKDEKKLDKPKRDNSKHKDSRRNERSRSPSKKELSRKSDKRTDRKERSPRNDKYHKKRDEKKSKELEVKKKSLSPGVKVQLNETVAINCEIPSKEDTNKFNEKTNNESLNLDLPIIEQTETNVPIEKVVVNEVIKEEGINNSIHLTTELAKTDSSLEDSDSLKRLRMYMQTMKKSPEPSNVSPVKLKIDSDIHAVVTNQSKIKLSDRLYFILKFIVGELLLFLNKLDTFLYHYNIKTITFSLSPIIFILFFFFLHLCILCSTGQQLILCGPNFCFFNLYICLNIASSSVEH